MFFPRPRRPHSTFCLTGCSQDRLSQTVFGMLLEDLCLSLVTLSQVTMTRSDVWDLIIDLIRALCLKRQTVSPNADLLCQLERGIIFFEVFCCFVRKKTA